VATRFLEGGGKSNQGKRYIFATAIPNRSTRLTCLSEAQFNRLFQSWENYDEPYCFTGQLFVRDGHPFNSDWLPMDNMPERPLAPRYGPARP